MRALLDSVSRRYGARPIHLVSLLACFAFVGYVISLLGVKNLWNTHVWWQSIIVWFIGAIVLHDLVHFPFYAIAARSLGAGWRAISGRRSTEETKPLVSPINYVRLPFMGSGLLLLMFFPGIIQQGKASYLRATGLTLQPYLDRWLWITATMFAVSALCYGVRVAVVRARSAHDTPAVSASVESSPSEGHAS